MMSNTEISALIKSIDAGTYGIEAILSDIAGAEKGANVRKAIYALAYALSKQESIGTVDTEARQRIETLLKANLGTATTQSIGTVNVGTSFTNLYEITGLDKNKDYVIMAYATQPGVTMYLSTNGTASGVFAAGQGNAFGIRKGLSSCYVGGAAAAASTSQVNLGIAYMCLDSTEVVDARVGEDGTVYSTLGDAVRGQVAEMKQELSGMSEATKNINAHGVALRYVGADGKIKSSPHGTYVGIGDFVKCEPGVKYTVTFRGVTWGEEVPKFVLFDGYNTTSETEPFKRLQRNIYSNTYTITTPEDAYEMYVDIYNENGILTEDGEAITADGAIDKVTCQIELGEKSTEYIRPTSAVDEVVRREIKGLNYAAPPEYYMENLKTACAAAMDHATGIGMSGNKQDGIQFIFFSDPHWGENAKNSPALALYAKNHTTARYVICGGDALTRSSVKANMVAMAKEFANAFKPVAPVEFIFGNHDRNQNNNSDTALYLSDEEVYSTLFRNTSDEAVWNGYFNHYVDDVKSNTRLVFITQYYQGNNQERYNEQMAWIKAVADASQSMNIIYFMHCTRQGEATHMNTIKAKHDEYGNVRAIFSGHRHLDAVECYQSEVEGRNPVPIITIDADCMKRLKKATETGIEDREDAKAGTIEEQCLDIVTIKYSANTVYCDRIGRGSSRVIIDGEVQD